MEGKPALSCAESEAAVQQLTGAIQQAIEDEVKDFHIALASGSITSQLLKQAVARGASLLDVATPKWEQLLDLQALDMSKTHLCVLGQIWGSHHNGCLYLESLPDAEEEGLRLTQGGSLISSYYGFESEDGLSEEYEALSELWREEINARLLRKGHRQ